MMTRADFQAIADAIRTMPTDGDLTMRDDMASKIADALQTRNHRFNRATFLRACGVIEPEINE